MLIVFIDIPRVIRNGLHPSRTHSTRPDLSGLAQGGRKGIWDVMLSNINNVAHSIIRAEPDRVAA
jgi:hypothetical protein